MTSSAPMRFLGSLVTAGALLAGCAGSDTAESNEGAAGSASTMASDIERAAALPEAPMADWVAGINSAGWQFHRTLDGNAVSSPVSLGTAFSFARAGASGDTGPTLDVIFGFPSEPGVHEGANAATQTLEEATTGTSTLEVSNRLFTRIQPNQDFVDVGAQYYGAGVEVLESTGGADQVNSWVDARTRGLIPTIVTPEIVAQADAILANTVYLKADWAQPFLADLTQPDTFTTANGTTVQADFMSAGPPMNLRHTSVDGAHAVELPYLDGGLAMWLVVPDDIDGLPDLEARLDAAALLSLGDDASAGAVALSLPKWTHELPPTDLFANWLCPNGLCPGAPFGGLGANQAITTAVHGAKIIVDEKGTEAAAATAMSFATSAPQIDLALTVDRPFLYAIVHEPSGALVFVGRVTDPTAAS